MVYSLTEGHLGILFLTITNKAVMNIWIQIFVLSVKFSFIKIYLI